jgi:hypothetical protein
MSPFRQKTTSDAEGHRVSNVHHYAGGKNDWRDAGLPLEGGRV